MQHLRGDVNLSWPSGQIAVMGSKGAVEIIYKGKKNGNSDVLLSQRLAEYEAKFNTPFQAAKYGFIDDIIRPRDTRARICAELELLKEKKALFVPERKHSTMPL